MSAFEFNDPDLTVNTPRSVDITDELGAILFYDDGLIRLDKATVYMIVTGWHRFKKAEIAPGFTVVPQ